MSCERFEEVCLLLDGELPADRQTRVREHLATCAQCGAMAREQRARCALLAGADGPAEEQIGEALAAVLRRGRSRFWHRRLELPLPLAAAVLLLFAGALLWAAVKALPPRPEAAPVPARTDAMSGSALDRYDHGGPPVLYTLRREEG